MAIKLHSLRCLANSMADSGDDRGFANCMKLYIKGLRGPRECSVSERQLQKVFLALPSVTGDFYHKATMELILDDDIGFGTDTLTKRENSSYKYWVIQ